MGGAVVSFTSMAVAGREVSVELDTFEILLYRSVLGVVLVVAGARLLGTLGGIRARRMGWHGARNVSHFAGQNLWFYAIATAPWRRSSRSSSASRSGWRCWRPWSSASG
jgi:hypothetical protein